MIKRNQLKAKLSEEYKNKLAEIYSRYMDLRQSDINRILMEVAIDAVYLNMEMLREKN